MKCAGCSKDFTSLARSRHGPRKYCTVECANKHLNPPQDNCSPKSRAQRERRHARAKARGPSVPGMSAEQRQARIDCGLPL